MSDKTDPKLAYLIRQLMDKVSVMEQQVEDLRESPQRYPQQTLEDAIDSIPGRRVFYTLVGTQTFTTTNDGARGNAITFEISQDGPFIMTHYPFVMWRSTLPTNATDFGRWRTVCTAYLPTQQLTTNFIDISYEMSDSGSQRNFQNDQPVPPLLSKPDDIVPLPVQSLFKPQSVISFIPTYNDILLAGSTATTQGTLVVALPGYKIINL